MYSETQFSNGHRLIRSLLPSAFSGIACVCFGIFIVGAYLFMQSISLGTSLPNLFDGEWGALYTNAVVQPVATLFNNGTVNKMLIILLWGLLGLVCYLVIETTGFAFKRWREAKNDVQVTTERIVWHAGIKEYLEVVFWRVFLLVVYSIIAVTVVQPLLQALAIIGPHAILGGDSLAESIKALTLLVTAWTLIAHLTVVFLRLFMRRMRLYSDDPF